MVVIFLTWFNGMLLNEIKKHPTGSVKILTGCNWVILDLKSSKKMVASQVLQTFKTFIKALTCGQERSNRILQLKQFLSMCLPTVPGMMILLVSAFNHH